MPRWSYDESPAPTKAIALGDMPASGHVDSEVEYQLGRLLVSSNTSYLNRAGSFPEEDDEEFVEDRADATDGWDAVEKACRQLLADLYAKYPLPRTTEGDGERGGGEPVGVSASAG
ncbi:hypothetical protein [Kitasatospora sp. NPDC017646]|uniref:hypothetical protein n=1 Tax=Kitasatospora sp. NPDC017646 TaxID=3364024 RepID=UPI0037AEE576